MCCVTDKRTRHCFLFFLKAKYEQKRCYSQNFDGQIFYSSLISFSKTSLLAEKHRCHAKNCRMGEFAVAAFSLKNTSFYHLFCFWLAVLLRRKQEEIWKLEPSRYETTNGNILGDSFSFLICCMIPYRRETCITILFLKTAECMLPLTIVNTAYRLFSSLSMTFKLKSHAHAVFLPVNEYFIIFMKE